MTYESLRAAIEAGPTSGDWKKGSQNDVRIGSRRLCHVYAGEQLSIGKDVERGNINAAYIAAASPAVISALLRERDALREYYEANEAVSRVYDEVSPGLTSPPGPDHYERLSSATERFTKACSELALEKQQ